MPGSTPIYGFPYPDPSDLVANYPALGQDLAEDIETVINGLGSGLNIISPTSIANSGGSAARTNGQVTFTAVNSISVNGVFSSTYDAYAIIFIFASSGTTDTQVRLRAAGTDSATSYEVRVNYFQSTYGTATSTTTIRLGDNGTQKCHSTMNLADVAKASPTSLYIIGNDGAANSNFMNGGIHSASTIYDGFSLFSASDNLTGTVRVYGYKNS